MYGTLVADEILLQCEGLRAALGACKDAAPMGFGVTLENAFGCEGPRTVDTRQS